MHDFAGPSIASSAGWQAALELRFERREQQTLLTRKLHRGPLLVQKALYPEGRETCHAAILHPPGGIAAGDELKIDVGLDVDSHALLTTPGATKWYRSGGASASQTLSFQVSAAAVLEWLPRENIFFDGSNILMGLDVDLTASAGYFGWDIFSFGRRAAGESWRRGKLRVRTRIRRDGRMIWTELAYVDARSGFMQSAAGLAGRSVCGTLVVAGYEIAAPLLVACREIKPKTMAAMVARGTRAAVTHLPRVLLARYIGDSTEEAFEWFVRLWSVLRPELASKAAAPPRVWAC